MYTTTSDRRSLRIHVWPGHVDAPSARADLVLLEAGQGASARYWTPVAEALTPHVSVAAYDRAGFGGSDPAPPPRDLAALSADLDAVLAAVPHRRSVLVGHSWGGPIVRTLAARTAAEGRIEGLVLVDPSDERAHLYFGRVGRWSSRLQDAGYVPLARLGLLRPVARRMLTGLPEPLLAQAVQESTTVEAARAAVAENRHTIPELVRLRKHPPDLGGMPVRVISGTGTSGLERFSRASLVAAHRATVASLPNARHVEAGTSGHMIPVTEPELVATQVLDLLNATTGTRE